MDPVDPDPDSDPDPQHCSRENYPFSQMGRKCGRSGIWSPKQAPVCISRNNNVEPLGGMMCSVPEDVASASYRAVEGVVTPNGALHGTILEYNCNIGYRRGFCVSFFVFKYRQELKDQQRKYRQERQTNKAKFPWLKGGGGWPEVTFLGL